MGRSVTRAEIEAAVRLPAGGRSDFDLNPDAGRALDPGRRLRPAAVLIGIAARADGLRVLLTQRPRSMKEHAGQIAFPGGKIDESDADAVDAALREAEEEIGLPRRMAEVVGEIDAYETGTGFRITPVVAFVDGGFVPRPHAEEVDDVFEPPLDFLMDPANCERRTGHWAGRERLYYAMPWEGRFIWGATAGMLKSLSDRLGRVR